jgi:hypothetical protein
MWPTARTLAPSSNHPGLSLCQCILVTLRLEMLKRRRGLCTAALAAALFLFLLPPASLPPLPHGLRAPPPAPALNAATTAAAAAAALPAPPPPCRAWLRLYIEHRASVELHFLLTVALRDARAACGLCIRLLPRADFAADLARGGCAPLLLAANTDLLEAEVAALRAHPAQARARVLVFHYSDEHEDRPLPPDAYGLPRLLLRNYLSASAERRTDMTYLQPPPLSQPPPPSRRLWVPLGHADAFAPSLAPALRTRTRDRPYAWSWAGSSGGKWARDYFLRGLEAFPQRAALLRAGRLHVYERFMDAAQALRPLEYSAWLYESRVAPCPNGGSSEQFRVWEALEAGAVPLLPRMVGDAHLDYMDALGLQALWIPADRWHLDAAPLLLAAAGGAGGEANASFVAALEGMQGHNEAALRGVYARLSARLGAEACAAAGLPCSASSASSASSGGSGGSGSCPATAEPPAVPSCEGVEWGA